MEILNIEDETDFNPDYYVYTDGACSNNGRENAKAGIGIFLGQDDPRNVSEPVEGKQSNNTAELIAIIKTWPIIKQDILNSKKVTIVSDSVYAIRCASSYGEKCSNQGWKKDIPNKYLVKIAFEIYHDQQNVQFMHIKAHTSNLDIHSLGNDGADKLANKGLGLVKRSNLTDNRIYLNVPFSMKDHAKKKGAKWDGKKKSWFVYSDYKLKEELLEMFPVK